MSNLNYSNDENYGNKPKYGYNLNVDNVEAQNQDNEWGNMGNGLSDKVIRIQFIRKVYLIVTTQLIFTFGVCLLFVSVDSINNWVRTSKAGFALYLVS